MDYTALATLIGTIIVGYMSYRLGKQQLHQTTRSSELLDRTTGESEFRRNLLELLDQQEDKLTKQDNKIERLDIQIEDSRKLTTQLKRANFDLALENDRLTRLVGSLQIELNNLAEQVRILTQKLKDREAQTDATQ